MHPSICPAYHFQLLTTLCLAILACSAARLARPGAGRRQSPCDERSGCGRRKGVRGRKPKRTGLNSAPGDAAMLRILVESSNAKRGVEVGTSTGYGAILMGLGFERTGGKLITVDIDPKAVQTARANLEKMGLSSVVTCVEGNALEVLPKLEGEFDFVYLDAVKSDYLKYFKALEPKLTPGALVVADNVIRSAKSMTDFFEAMATNSNYLSTTIRSDDSKRDGMMVIYKLK